MTHKLKIWPWFYDAVANGSKTFEYRINDRGFQKGDKVELLHFDPSEATYSDVAPLCFEIGYVFQIPDSKYCVFSLINKGEN